MRRLFCEALPPEGGAVALDGAARRHAKVLRLEVGAALALFDGEGGEADATVRSLDPLVCDASARRVAEAPAPRVVLCYCLPKGNAKLDQAVRGATEVGVVAIHLAVSERSVSRSERPKRLERLRRIAREAARQSLRATVPEVHPPAPLAEVAARAPRDVPRFVCAPDAPPAGGAADDAWVLVGPEGGLSEAELTALEAAGWRRLGLGPTVLRTETAAVVAPAVIADRLRR